MATPEEQIIPAGAAAITTGTGRKGPEEYDLPENLKYDMDLYFEILCNVLDEYGLELLSTFDIVRHYAVETSAERFAELKDPNPGQDGLKEAVNIIDNMTLHDAQLLTCAFATHFRLANLSRGNYRASIPHERENNVPVDQAVDPINELAVVYHQLINETDPAKVKELLNQLKFHPVFTAHPTEAHRKTVEGRICRVFELLEEYKCLGGSDKKECLRHLYGEIDTLFRTSLIALKKPTLVEGADTILGIFDNTLFNTIPKVYRRFDGWVLGGKTGLAEPACPALFHPDSWIGSDRGGNLNVAAEVSRAVARKFSDYVIAALEQVTRTVSRNLTMEAETTPPSTELKNLWSHQEEMNECLTGKAAPTFNKEMCHAVMLVMADRLHYITEHDTDLIYHSCDNFLADLKVVQRSLAAAGTEHSAYSPLQSLIWQTETSGFHTVEMEFRQHSVVHARALADIHEHGLHDEHDELQPMTHKVLDAFHALGAIQKRNGLKAARRCIISFAKSAQNIKGVYGLNRLAFFHPEDAPTINVAPLFEQLEGLQNSVDVLEEMIKIPEVQARLRAAGNKLEVMPDYSDSSKDADLTSTTLAPYSAQERTTKWAGLHDIDLTLFHGRGGTIGRGSGPVDRAALTQPIGSVRYHFKPAKQGKVIFAHYDSPVLAVRHVESAAAATLLQSAPSVGKRNAEMTKKYADMAAQLDEAVRNHFLDLLDTDGFAPWFSIVTPLAEIGLLPIGSRPAKCGLGTKSLDGLRTVPWTFSWIRARINLAAWYDLGTAREKFGDLETMHQAYEKWSPFSTFIDNIEMSIAKTDERVTRMYLTLGGREDLNEKIISEMELAHKWVLAIVGDKQSLQHRHALGQTIRIRSPYVSMPSVTQVLALKSLRKKVDKEELSQGQQAGFIYLILYTVSGVAASL